MRDIAERIKKQLKLEGYRDLFVSIIPMTYEILVDHPSARGSVRINIHKFRGKSSADCVHIIREEIKVSKLLGVYYDNE